MPSSSDSPIPPTTPAPTPPAQPVRPRWKRVLRRLLVVGAIASLLLLAVFFLIPVWISNEQGRDYVLERLNKRLAGSAPNPYEANAQVRVDKWALGWFRPTELTNLRIQRPDGTVILFCPRVQSGLTLWDIFWGNYDLRTTTAHDLHFAVTKYPDGRSSLDLLTRASGAEDLLRTVRGSLQISGGEVSVTSIKTGETIRFGNIRADVSIGSVDAPVYLQASATGTTEVVGRDRGTMTGDLSIRATLPPVRSMATAAYWLYLQDIDFATTNVPSGLFLDCLGIDTAWSQSLGPTLDIVRFINHAPAPTAAGQAVLLVQGKPQPGDPTPPTRIDARLSATRELIELRPVAAADHHLQATLRMSPLLAEVLRRVHPLLGDVNPQTRGLVELNTTALRLPTGNPVDTEMSGRLSFPLLSFGAISAQRGESFLATLGNFVPRLPADAPLTAEADPLRFRLTGRKIEYENFALEFQPPRGVRVIFAGMTTLPGQLDMVATIPSGRARALSSGTMQVLIQGTVDHPLFRRAE